MLWLISGALASPPPATAAAPSCSDPSPSVSRILRANGRADQRERKKRQYDGMQERDDVRLAFVHEQLKGGGVCSPKDAWWAGVVLQHSGSTTDHRAAFDLFRWACDEGIEDACSWAALAWDRHLVSNGEPQWYGTQWVGRIDPETNEHVGMCLVRLATPSATDADRATARRKPIAEVIAETYEANHQEAPAGATLTDLDKAGFVCEPTPWGRDEE